MRFITLFIALILTAQTALAQQPNFVRNDNLATTLNGADKRPGSAAVDTVGKIYTTLSPEGKTWSACSGVETGTADRAIKAAVASNRIYVTSITCMNNSVTASTISIKDGASTTLYQSLLSANTIASFRWDQTFPVPLRGSVNTALNFAMTTTSTGTSCCAAGYISPN